MFLEMVTTDKRQRSQNSGIITIYWCFIIGNKSTNSVTTETTLVSTNSTCMSLIQCVDEANSSFHDSVVLTLACKTHFMNWMAKYLKWCGWDYCHRVFNSYSIGTPSMPESFLAALYGPSILESLCHFLQIGRAHV